MFSSPLAFIHECRGILPVNSQTADLYKPAAGVGRRGGLLFHGAGAESEDGIGWAPADGTGGEWHNTQPAPDTDIARKRQANQNQTQNNAQDAVNTANI